jgi:hypothetical protein
VGSADDAGARDPGPPEHPDRPTRRRRRTTPWCSTRPLTLPSTTAIRHSRGPTGNKSDEASGVLIGGSPSLGSPLVQISQDSLRTSVFNNGL